MNKIQQFIDSIENKNTAKVIKHVLKRVPESIENFNLIELNTFILELKPRSKKDIITTVYVLNTYAKWLYEQKLVKADTFQKNIEKIDKNNLWKLAKPNAERKFISHSQFKEIIANINSYEEYNPLYYETLFTAIYEGIYTDDLSILSNLRCSDVEENIVTLHEDNGNEYKLKISKELALKLKELSKIDSWYRPNRYSVFPVPMTGLYNDSVFKAEARSTSSEDARKFVYYNKLRKIKDEYIGYNIEPLQIYASGIIHRLKYILEKNNITLEETFAENSHNTIANKIVSQELKRCNNIISQSNFRELVNGHIEMFSNDTTDDIDDDIFLEIHDEQQEFLEGKEILDIHISHERDEKIVALAKEKFKLNHSGKLFCEQCGFNFAEKYGERGEDFIEVHHTKFISNRKENEVTNVEDLVMLCSNCHSIVHRKLPWLSMTELKNILKKNEK